MQDLTDIQKQILMISLFLSTTWGIYLFGTIREYLIIRESPMRRRQDVVVALRRFVIALCIWLFVFSYAFRVVSIGLGVEESTVSVITFFALLGSNVVGSIFSIVSLWLD